MLRLLDTHHLGRAGVTCVGLAGNDQLTLIDCGPETVFANTLRALRAAGYQPEQVTDVVVTHVHLDHSGAAWRWATEFGAKISAHPNGAPHLRDPARLLASARRVFGERLEILWGEVQPVPADRLHVLHDGEWIGSGPTRFRAIETPGHASHHHAYWHDESRSIFAGDIAGVSIGGGPLLPPCPPPDIDLEVWHRSLEKLRALKPATILLSHCGIVSDADSLKAMENRLTIWAEWVLQRLRAGESEQAMVPAFEQFVWDELRASGVTEDGIRAYEQCDPAAMSVFGLVRYWRKHHSESFLT